MKIQKYSPVIILSVSAIVLIILFTAVAASGFRGLLPGSFFYKNKNENGFYVFQRLLEELDYKIVFEKRYRIPPAKSGTAVYADINNIEDDFREKMLNWVKEGNSIVLFDNAVNIFFDDDAVEYTGSIAGELKSDKVFRPDFLEKLKNTEIISKNSEGALIVCSEYGNGSILIISDRRIFCNLSMESFETAYLLDRLFYDFREKSLYLREKGAEAVYDPSLVKGLLKGRLSVLTFHLLLIFIIIIVISSKRFSKPQDLSASTLRKISEHIKAAGMFYHKAEASDLIERTDTEYFKWVICRNRKPAILSREEYEDNIKRTENLSEDEIFERFIERNKYIKKIRSNR